MPSSPPVSELTAHLGFWLRAVSNHVSHAFAARLEGKGVTVAEWVLMRTLHGQEPMAPSRIAETMGMTRGAITKLADRLIAKDLVTRVPSPDDGRAQTLALTAQGAKLVPVLAELADQNDTEFFSMLSPSERQTLERLLRRMVAEGRMRATPVD
jgi:DNA-binding MarR family transcriptional regulator